MPDTTVLIVRLSAFDEISEAEVIVAESKDPVLWNRILGEILLAVSKTNAV